MIIQTVKSVTVIINVTMGLIQTTVSVFIVQKNLRLFVYRLAKTLC